MSHSPRAQDASRARDRQNYRLCVANGVFTQLGMNISHPSLVLSVFVRVLGGSNALVGTLSAIRFGGWFFPQFLVASYTQPRRYKTPVTVAFEIVRVSIYAAMGVLTYTWARARPDLLLIVFFGLFTMSRLTAGSGALARADVLGKVIQPARRAAFFAQRNLWGGVAGFGAGLLVRYVLEEENGWSLPANFTLLFGLSTLAFLAALLLFAQVKEQPDPAGMPRHSLREQLKRAPTLLKNDHQFRRYVTVRLLLNMTRLSEPFYPILALDTLGAPPSMVGFYMAASTFSRVLSNLLWQRLARRRGNIVLVKASALLTTLEPLSALLLPWLMGLSGLTSVQVGLLPAYVYTLVFLISGAALSGRSIGLLSLLLDIAPDSERASYIGLTNTLLGVISLLPVLAGALIDSLGFASVFVPATLLLILGYTATIGWQFQMSGSGDRFSADPGGQREAEADE